MEQFDFDLDKLDDAGKPPKKGLGCAFGGWLLFAVFLALVIFVGYRTVYFVKQIRSGEIVDLPQYGDRLTSVVSGNTVIGNTVVTRSEVESSTAPAAGPSREDADIVIVEFADFQCPYSKEESDVVRRLMTKYGDRVRFEYRDYPLDEIHTEATQAALAGRCAQEQGKFWAMHDKLFNSSPDLTMAVLNDMAVQSGLDGIQFERCMLDGRYRAAVQADLTKAKSLGLRGTPTFFINGKRLAQLGHAQLRAAIRAELN